MHGMDATQVVAHFRGERGAFSPGGARHIFLWVAIELGIKDKDSDKQK